VEPSNQAVTKTSMSIPGQQGTSNPYLIQPATIVEKIREADDIDTYRLQFVDEQARRSYRFAAGQFNMVYLFGSARWRFRSCRTRTSRTISITRSAWSDV